MKNSDSSKLFSAVDYVVSSSGDLSVFFAELAGFWRDMTVMRYSSDDSAYLELTDAEKKIVKDASAMFSPEELLYQSGLIESSIAEMNRLPQIKRFIAEISLLKMSDNKLKTSPDALLARIADLEDQIKLIKAGTVSAIDSDNSPLTDNDVNEQNDPDTDDKTVGAEEESQVPEIVSDENKTTDVEDPGEFISKLSALNASVGMIVRDSLLKIENNKKLIITVEDDFSSMMLKRNDVLPQIRQAAVVSGLFDVQPEIKIVISEKANDQIDAFSDFI